MLQAPLPVNPPVYTYAGSNPAPATHRKRASDQRKRGSVAVRDIAWGYGTQTASAGRSSEMHRPLICATSVKDFGARHAGANLGRGSTRVGPTDGLTCTDDGVGYAIAADLGSVGRLVQRSMHCAELMKVARVHRPRLELVRSCHAGSRRGDELARGLCPMI